VRAAGRCAQAAARSSRAPVPAHVPAARPPGVEMAVRVAWPNAEGAAAAVQPDVAVAVGVVRPDVVAAGAVVQPGAAAGVVVQPGAAAEEAEPAAAGAPGAQGALEGELPLGVAWAFRQDPLLPSVRPRSTPTARAMGWSWSVAWPSTRSWQAALFSGLSCALGPAENSEARSRNLRGGSTADDQQTSVRPDCGGFQTGTRIYFSRDTMCVGGCSRRIQEAISSRKFDRLRAEWS
jgi:hypothetical protein